MLTELSCLRPLVSKSIQNLTIIALTVPEIWGFSRNFKSDHKPRPLLGSNSVGLYCLGRLDSKRAQNLVILSSAVEFFQIFKVKWSRDCKPRPLWGIKISFFAKNVRFCMKTKFHYPSFNRSSDMGFFQKFQKW